MSNRWPSAQHPCQPASQQAKNPALLSANQRGACFQSDAGLLCRSAIKPVQHCILQRSSRLCGGLAGIYMCDSLPNCHGFHASLSNSCFDQAHRGSRHITDQLLLDWKLMCPISLMLLMCPISLMLTRPSWLSVKAPAMANVSFRHLEEWIEYTIYYASMTFAMHINACYLHPHAC